MPPHPQSKRRLDVEGTDDKFSIINLLVHHGVNWDGPDIRLPYVNAAGSVEKALDALKAAPLGFERYGIVVDADSALTDRWAQICDRLRQHNIACPKVPDPSGTIVTGLRPAWRLGIWLMPDNSNAGILEDFLAKLVPAGDPCWTYAQEATSTARDNHHAPLELKDTSKGSLYTWLAWQKKPGLPFGTALNAGMLAHDSPDALRFVAWFHRLFFQD
jgi:hypothetical protein